MAEKTCLVKGGPVEGRGHEEINPATGQQKDYVVLCPDERAKGYVRPLRHVYIHKGRRPKYPLRDLTEEERQEFSNEGYVQYEEYPESERPARGRYWTQAEVDSGCGGETRIHPSIAETYARKPSFYGGTFCAYCKQHLPIAEFVWEDGSAVGS